MDKEVELILSKLKIVSEEQERGMYLCDKEHSKLLLDYITNLQQENESLKKDRKYLLQYYNEDYKSRIEKAVEFINDDENLWVALGEDCGHPDDDLEELLNILNGRSDE